MKEKPSNFPEKITLQNIMSTKEGAEKDISYANPYKYKADTISYYEDSQGQQYLVKKAEADEKLKAAKEIFAANLTGFNQGFEDSIKREAELHIDKDNNFFTIIKSFASPQVGQKKAVKFETFFDIADNEELRGARTKAFLEKNPVFLERLVDGITRGDWDQHYDNIGWVQEGKVKIPVSFDYDQSLFEKGVAPREIINRMIENSKHPDGGHYNYGNLFFTEPFFNALERRTHLNNEELGLQAKAAVKSIAHLLDKKATEHLVYNLLSDEVKNFKKSLYKHPEYDKKYKSKIDEMDQKLAELLKDPLTADGKEIILKKAAELQKDLLIIQRGLIQEDVIKLRIRSLALSLPYTYIDRARGKEERDRLIEEIKGIIIEGEKKGIDRNQLIDYANEQALESYKGSAMLEQKDLAIDEWKKIDLNKEINEKIENDKGAPKQTINSYKDLREKINEVVSNKRGSYLERERLINELTEYFIDKKIMLGIKEYDDKRKEFAKFIYQECSIRDKIDYMKKDDASYKVKDYAKKYDFDTRLNHFIMQHGHDFVKLRLESVVSLLPDAYKTGNSQAKEQLIEEITAIVSEEEKSGIPREKVIKDLKECYQSLKDQEVIHDLDNIDWNQRIVIKRMEKTLDNLDNLSQKESDDLKKNLTDQLVELFPDGDRKNCKNFINEEYRIRELRLKPKPILNDTDEFKGDGAQLRERSEHSRDLQNSSVSFKNENGIKPLANFKTRFNNFVMQQGDDFKRLKPEMLAQPLTEVDEIKTKLSKFKRLKGKITQRMSKFSKTLSRNSKGL